MRTETEVTLESGSVCKRDRYIAGLHGNEAFMGFEIIVGRKDSGTDEFLLQNIHKIKQILRLRVTDIIDGIWC